MHEAVAALQAQLGENSPLDASQMPTDIKDAIDTPDKLKYFKNAVETLASMPAGYLDDKEDKQWLLKVGENYTSADEIKDMVLCKIDGIGDIRLSDVAQITTVDNAGDAYAKVNGQPGGVLSVFKGSTAGTSDVSKVCKQAISKLQEEYPGLQITPLVDQGDYISMITDSIVSSMVIGAFLAILILAVFLMDIRPTLVVAFSIPFRVQNRLPVQSLHRR